MGRQAAGGWLARRFWLCGCESRKWCNDPHPCARSRTKDSARYKHLSECMLSRASEYPPLPKGCACYCLLGDVGTCEQLDRALVCGQELDRRTTGSKLVREKLLVSLPFRISI